MSDPRSPACRAFALDAQGRVAGVELHVRPDPDSPYALLRVDLIDEATAQGNIIARTQVLDADNLPVSLRCALCWPWDGWTPGARFPNTALPGNANYPYEHPIYNTYTPPAQGPLAIALVDAEGNVLSDVCGGLGLPGGRHVSYALIFRARTAEPEPEPEPEPGSDVLTVLVEMRDLVARLAQHLGA